MSKVTCYDGFFMNIPEIDEMMRTVLESFADEKIHTPGETRRFVIKTMNLPKEIEKDNKWASRMGSINGAFSRYGVIKDCSNDYHRMWRITPKGISIYKFGPKEITRGYLKSIRNLDLIQPAGDYEPNEQDLKHTSGSFKNRKDISLQDLMNTKNELNEGLIGLDKFFTEMDAQGTVPEEVADDPNNISHEDISYEDVLRDVPEENEPAPKSLKDIFLEQSSSANTNAEKATVEALEQSVKNICQKLNDKCEKILLEQLLKLPYTKFADLMVDLFKTLGFRKCYSEHILTKMHKNIIVMEDVNAVSKIFIYIDEKTDGSDSTVDLMTFGGAVIGKSGTKIFVSRRQFKQEIKEYADKLDIRLIGRYYLISELIAYEVGVKHENVYYVTKPDPKYFPVCADSHNPCNRKN